MAKIEILAPAGGYDSVVAAVRSGADAVYVGEKRFSARASAKNFSDEELRHAVAYCHVHGVKVYVTLNTLVFDEEFEALAAAIRAAAEADADALIVQNMGVARLARQIAPELPLHASTQMSVHTASGVQALCEMGFGSRSGNRGACAQTCRLPFSVNSQKGGYALSLKDNSLIPHLADMQAIGIASAKIEGRMKRPEYVAAAVRACVEQRDFGFITDQTAAQLRGVFSRTGFTDGYYTGKRGAGMFGTRTRDDVVSADEKLLAQIRQGYKDEYSHVPLSGSFSAKIGERAALTLTDGAHTVAVFSECKAEPAQKVALTAEKCRFQLGKTGGTAYLLDAVSINIEEALSLPLAALNTMRREALEQMNRLRANRHHYQINNITIQAPEPYRPSARTTRVRIPKTKIGKGFRACEIVFVPLFSDTREWERLQQEGYPLGVEIPRGMFGREEQIERQLRRAGEAGVTHALCQNIGAVYVAKQLGFVLHGGFGLNLCNTYDLLWAEETGLADTELSLELTFERIDRLGGSIGRGIVSYGYLPLMLCRNCPAKSIGLDCKTCKNNSKMTDRKGKRFLLRCDGNSTEVLNCVPLYIAEKEISKLSTSFRVLRFTVENYVENVENAWEINDFSMLKDNFTRGLYKRGVL